MIKEKATIKNIYLKIVEMGYKGKYGMVKCYVSKLKANETLLIEEKLTRKQVMNLLYKPLADLNNIDKEKLLKAYKLFPMLKIIIELMLKFKSILLKIRKQNVLDSWIRKARN